MVYLAYLKVFFLSMLPIGELRLAIPLGIFYYHLNWFYVFISAFLGNIFPVILLLLIFKKVSEVLENKFPFLNYFWSIIIEKNKKKHSKKFSLLGSLALVTLVAIPLPFTGAWTGALCAFIFKVKPLKAFLLISLGVLIAGFIVALLCLGL